MNSFYNNFENIFETEEDCPVCYTRLYNIDILEPCQHKVHLWCIEQHCQVQQLEIPVCPLCRVRCTNINRNNQVEDEYGEYYPSVELNKENFSEIFDSIRNPILRQSLLRCCNLVYIDEEIHQAIIDYKNQTLNTLIEDFNIPILMNIDHNITVAHFIVCCLLSDREVLHLLGMFECIEKLYSRLNRQMLGFMSYIVNNPTDDYSDIKRMFPELISQMCIEFE